MSIKVGHATNPANHERINDSSVSRVHLEVDKIDDDTLRIIDLGSTNGTWIDGFEIVESTLKRNQTIRIGHQKFTGEEFFRRINRHFLPRETVWVKEFAALEAAFKKYEKKKNKLSQSFQNKMNILRGVLSISIALLFYLYGEDMGIRGDLRFITSIGGGVLAGSIVPYLLSKENIVKDNLKLNREYSKILVCPRCKRDLSSRPYEYWKEERRCSCDAIWVQ